MTSLMMSCIDINTLVNINLKAFHQRLSKAFQSKYFNFEIRGIPYSRQILGEKL